MWGSLCSVAGGLNRAARGSLRGYRNGRRGANWSATCGHSREMPSVAKIKAALSANMAIFHVLPAPSPPLAPFLSVNLPPACELLGGQQQHWINITQNESLALREETELLQYPVWFSCSARKALKPPGKPPFAPKGYQRPRTNPFCSTSCVYIKLYGLVLG